jgi:malate dehydrogenase
MGRVAILGAGPLGAAIAHRLAERARVSRVLLVDSQPAVAAGKALDIRQSGPVGGFDTVIEAAEDPLAASGAEVIVVADDTTGGEWEGERGLALVSRLTAAGAPGALVCAGAGQTWLVEAAVREAGFSASRIVGTAASAMPPIVAALVGIETGRAGVEVGVSGRPPGFVVGWTAASAGGALVTEQVPAHRLLAISQALPKLWPPGVQAIAAPTARVVEALAFGSRRVHHVMTVVDSAGGARGAAVLLPVELGPGRILRRLTPTFSPQERTAFLTQAEGRSG